MKIDRRRLIAIHGHSGSGKSIVSLHLKNAHNFTHASSGNLCRSITELLYGHQDRQSLNSISQAIRSIDKHLWISATLRPIDSERIVFDSVRYMEDAVYLKSLGFEIWKVVCPTEICIMRLKSRGQIFDLSDLSHDSESEIPNEFCSALIENYQRPIEAVLGEIDSLLRASP